MTEQTGTQAPPEQPVRKADPASRFVCIHGHFYQPPRENPWLEVIEEQPSAAPSHDWNERVTSECYGPNTAARIVSGSGKILDIRNNYEAVSFNFGPTLLSWMELRRPEVYEEILTADARSVEMRNGHGNALAQVFNHVIMPLQSRRDKETQVLWGIEDFRARFSRDPEGMWLSECAVDTPSLEVLAENGIRFTILSPGQAKAYRSLDSGQDWQRTSGADIDPSRPYLCRLPSGRQIVLFFYDGPISQAVAFEGLLGNGERFAQRLTDGFSKLRTWPQLSHIATDGESYGHHHRHGEMALAYAIHTIQSRGLARLTNYGEYLSMVDPEWEVQIWENSSWSCAHGVERWRSDCGCSTGSQPGWNQKWRGPLRKAFDHLKKKADEVFEDKGGKLFQDPWEARNRYIHVLLKRNSEAAHAFFQSHLMAKGNGALEREALRLIEIQRNSMLIYTSCAWFFDDIGGIESVQNLLYAARLLQLIEQDCPELEREFVSLLRRAPSNIKEIGDGARLWENRVRPALIDLKRVVANYAMCGFDERHEGTFSYYCFQIQEKDTFLSEFGSCRLKLANITIASNLSGEVLHTTVCVLHLGGHDFQCKIGPAMSAHDYKVLRQSLFKAFERRSLAEVIRQIDQHFGGRDYTLADLFDRNQTELLARLTLSGFERFESMLALMYDENRKLMEYLLEVGAPLPRGFRAVAEYVLRTRLQEELAGFGDNMPSSLAVATSLAREARHLGLNLVDRSLEGQLAALLELVFHELALMPTTELCHTAHELLDVIEMLDLSLDLWEAQNICFALVHEHPLPSHLAKRSRYERKTDSVVPLALVHLAERLKISKTPFAAPPASETEKSASAGLSSS